MKKSSNNVRVFKSLRILIVAALLAAMSIILGKYLAFNALQSIRISFENLPIIMAGIFFGPLVGAAVGIVADLVGCVLVGYAINPYITAGAAAIGLLSGVMSHYVIKNPLWARVLSAVLVSHVVGSLIIKTAGIYLYYSMPLYELILWRLLTYTVIGAAEFGIIYTLMRSDALMSQLGRLTKNK